MGAVLGVLFSPLTLLITKYGAGYLLFTLFLIPLILGLLIISIMVKMIYVFCFYFPNYLLFGFNSSTFQNESFLNVPSVWYHFLIVSIVIWILMFMITVIRFIVKGNSNESNEIIKSAFFMAMKGVGLLFIINGLIFVLNFIILSITSLLVSGDTSFENMMSIDYYNLLNNQNESVFFKKENNKIIPYFKLFSLQTTTTVLFTTLDFLEHNIEGYDTLLKKKEVVDPSIIPINDYINIINRENTISKDYYQINK
ncbi:hypothetical protein RNN91_04675 [Mycoplasmopsis felis]|uniref:hypothetical protein n=1 Tax=Mycoplasmopsis felis TaxID=33923 RepID=UPI002AF6CD47|nr:hypothetical protein [Mycoplasmopsis felis]WQQ01728.1 hypothetical protein RRG54_04055 [Mycoplasmopsis felis]